MNSLKVLDVTLRDGGCVNDFNFGQVYMEKILIALENSDIDYIELGYIDENKGTLKGRTQFCNERVISEFFLKNKKPDVTYVAMMDYGKFEVDRLKMRTEDSIDGIRLAFHKKNMKDIIDLGKKILDKGYEFYIQPMITLRYSDAELIQLIEMINKELPDASGFYIVDSFGEMRPNDMNRVLNLVDHNLVPNMTLGFHSHNNLQMSYSNAISFIQFPTNRNLMLDCSIMGMGKGAGNLNTELLLEHLNLYFGKHYKIAPLLEVMDTVLNQIRAEFYWGYSIEYYLSSVNGCTPSYAGHFYKKHMLPIDQVSDLLSMIDEEKKNSFNEEYAEELYRKYNEMKSVDDGESYKLLKDQLIGKEVVVIAPGKSVSGKEEEIIEIISHKNVISISLNNTAFNTDYVFITRADAYEDAVRSNSIVIVSSSVTTEGVDNVIFVDILWIVVDKNSGFVRCYDS